MTTSIDNNLKIIDLNQNLVIKQFQTKLSYDLMNIIGFYSQEEKLVLVPISDGSIECFEIEECQVVGKLKAEGECCQAAWAQGGRVCGVDNLG